MIGVDAFFSDAKFTESAPFFYDAQASQPHGFLHAADHAHDVTIDPGNHERVDPMSFHLADAHIGAFIIR
jgi:hypothetical protein